MLLKNAPLLLLLCCLTSKIGAQCSTLGQTPATAFPVCGSSVFKQQTVPTCVNNFIIAPCPADGNVYQDLNPYWYKFTCFKAGTLGFIIQPNNVGDDYDWQLFDVTGQNPDVVYTTNPNIASSIFVACDWSGNTDSTGASARGTGIEQCGSSPVDNPNPPTFTLMPQLKLGHNYLLMISHFLGDDQSGYSLSFKGGSASITDTTKPLLQSAMANCIGTTITLALNKTMACGSLAPDGSDFAISPALATVTAATGNTCESGFDMDSVTLTLSNALPGGSYALVAQNGDDGNTLLDVCGNSVPVGDSLHFSILPNQPTPFDSLSPVGCGPTTLQLVFQKSIACNSIAANGSDFVVTGASTVVVTGASGNCANGVTPTITVQLAAPILTAGNYQLQLVKGTDGNTIIDECGEETPPAALNFSTVSAVSAAFALQVSLGCKQDTVNVSDTGTGITAWQWRFNDGSSFATPTVTKYYSTYGLDTAMLAVTNGICSDTITQTFNLNNQLKAKFTSPALLCPEDEAVFADSSIGQIIAWNWFFGNGNTSGLQNPRGQTYPQTGVEKYYPTRLIVQDSACYDTAYAEIEVLKSCYIAVPSAFTPNGDGINDYLYPLNAYKAVNLQFKVFNRWGQLVFATEDWTKKWDGTLNGKPQASGVYVWVLTYTNVDSGKQYFQKGTAVLIR